MSDEVAALGVVADLSGQIHDYRRLTRAGERLRDRLAECVLRLWRVARSADKLC